MLLYLTLYLIASIPASLIVGRFIAAGETGENAGRNGADRRRFTALSVPFHSQADSAGRR